VLDLLLLGSSGLDLQRELVQATSAFQRFPDRLQRHTHVRARNEGRRGGVSHQARDDHALVNAIQQAVERDPYR
jgi:hypothetical protein